MLSIKEKSLILGLLENELNLVSVCKLVFFDNNKFAEIQFIPSRDVYYTITVSDNGLYVLTINSWNKLVGWEKVNEYNQMGIEELKGLLTNWYGVIDKEV